MAARDSLPESSIGYDDNDSFIPPKTDVAPMYTINDEPTWLQEATPTERMRLKYEVRSLVRSEWPLIGDLRCLRCSHI